MSMNRTSSIALASKWFQRTAQPPAERKFIPAGSDLLDTLPLSFMNLMALNETRTDPLWMDLVIFKWKMKTYKTGNELSADRVFNGLFWRPLQWPLEVLCETASLTDSAIFTFQVDVILTFVSLIRSNNFESGIRFCKEKTSTLFTVEAVRNATK